MQVLLSTKDILMPSDRSTNVRNKPTHQREQVKANRTKRPYSRGTKGDDK